MIQINLKDQIKMLYKIHNLSSKILPTKVKTLVSNKEINKTEAKACS